MHPLLVFARFFQFAGHGQRGGVALDGILLSCQNNPFFIKKPFFTSKTQVRQTTTVITTVGPFLKYGETLVAACADAGTHYVDITGEVSFMKWTYKKYVSILSFFCPHFPTSSCSFDAKKSGARTVHASEYPNMRPP